MMATETNSVMEQTDAEWVSQSLAGSRDAFARIVEHYQALVCSLAYSATGDLARSEDLAQETFVIAWKELRQLREPQKLRSWLCSIARSVISRAQRRQAREPAHAAESIEIAASAPSLEPGPGEVAIDREEATLLWRSLANLPEIYREPLILYYREEQSVASVAESLDLNEDAVKQRLSRGRKLLTEEVTSLVEGMLKRTKPGKAFTVGVIAALPAFAISAKAATAGAVAVKGTAAAQAAVSIGLAGAILGPILGVLGGWLGAKASIENTESPRERKFVIKMVRAALALAGAFVAAIFGAIFAIHTWWQTHPLPLALSLMGVLLAYGIALATLCLLANRAQQRIRLEESAKTPLGAPPPAPCPQQAKRTRFSAALQGFSSWEYQSRWTLLGLPLIHICLGLRQDGRLRPARGWIAGGEIAYGALVGVGSQVAVAPVSFAGGVALGILALGGGAAGGFLSIAGGFSLGAFGLGGGLAVGMLAAGGCAVGWHGALGGVALGHDFALGGAAFARHANDLAARSAIRDHSFFSSVPMVTLVARLIGFAALVQAGMVLWLIKKARTKQPPGGS